MIELRDNAMVFSFPEAHPQATLQIEFQRTLRIPDDGEDYPLPPGLGQFPLCHVDDFANKVPDGWIEHGGVMLPMYQSEAMWLNFDSTYIEDREAEYPFAIKVATGKIDAVTGSAWAEGVHRHPQDYVVAPKQPWLDGYCVEKGIIRQFVAMPLGSGYSAEEQITGKAEIGGIQIAVYPMKRSVFDRRFPKVKRHRRDDADAVCFSTPCLSTLPDMGVAPGGRMRQEIYDDPFRLEDWDTEHSSRCFVHLANSLTWRAITGKNPPTAPRTAEEYSEAGLPWFEYYEDEPTAVGGATILKGLKSIATLGKEKGDVPLPENESCTPLQVIELRQGLKEGQVREGAF